MGKVSLWAVDKYRNLKMKCGKPPVSAERIRICRRLHPREEPEEYLRRLDGGLFALAGGVLLTGCLLCLAVLWLRQQPERVDWLKRPDYGEPETAYELEVQKGKEAPLSVEVLVEERIYTEEEAEEALEAAYKEVLKSMLGENESIGHVTKALSLPEKALGGRVLADWRSKTPELFDDWGELKKLPGELLEEGETGFYELTLVCGEYSREYEIELTVCPPEQTEEEVFLERIKKEIEEKLETQKEAVRIELPDQYDGEPLTWYEESETGGGIWLFGIPVLCCVLLILREKQKEKKKLQGRETEMLLDYPEFVSKFTVLLQAGLAARNVWERMVKEYEERRKQGEKPRYVYEEMRITWNQMKNGMYESRAYGEFGRRCGIHAYMKFGALLEQNLKQGTTGLVLRLREEAEAAFEERKNLARRLSEEAETKLMLPMFMMLFMVLIVIMVPAFLSF